MTTDRIEKLTKVMLVSDIVEKERGTDAKEEISKAIAEYNKKVQADLIRSEVKPESD